MSPIKKQFLKIYNSFWGNDLSDIEQLKNHSLTGNELFEFSNFYFKERNDQSGIKHFYVWRKAGYIFAGITIGLLISVIFWLIILYLNNAK